MNGDTLYPIGELARRTRLTVKTIRFWSDRGIVTPAGRTGAGYRRYGPEAVARLALVRTLRELGIGLDTIRRVVDRELTLGEVAERHAAALEAQIDVLRLRHALLTTVARRRPTCEEFEEMERVHRLARLSRAERDRLIDDFLDSVFDGLDGLDGLDGGPAHAAARRSLTPQLPDDPTDEQVEAWVELAELSLDPDFRAGLRRGVEDHAAVFSGGAAAPPRPGAVAIVRDRAAAAVRSGIAPGSPEAAPVVAALTAHCARAFGRPDDAELRQWLLRRLSAARDTRRDRYCELLALVNGWPAPESPTPAIDWTVTALRASNSGSRPCAGPVA
ncbi:MerR family transcriptional regulator [Streptomyces sp. NPDC001480]|uniref:MerR family transcriptional regulator n=1 Tax=Streptomyces sp. NPDC001480 TaxID=3364577 RepID=UPI0036BB6EF4